MANEARIQASLSIQKTSNSVKVLDYVSRPSAFQANVAGTKGPVPGAINVYTYGVAVDLSQLVTPGLYRIMNLDDTNYVEFGLRDPVTGAFYPLNEILPGESYVGRFSRNIQEDYYNTGTGTTADIKQVWLKANHATCVVVLEAFEK